MELSWSWPNFFIGLVWGLMFAMVYIITEFDVTYFDDDE